MNERRLHKWYKSTSVTADNIEKLKKMIMDNRRNAIREVPDDVSIVSGPYQATVLIMKSVATKFVPKLCRLKLSHDYVPAHT